MACTKAQFGDPTPANMKRTPIVITQVTTVVDPKWSARVRRRVIQRSNAPLDWHGPPDPHALRDPNLSHDLSITDNR